MTTIARLLEQRSIGEVMLRMQQAGPAIIRESGSLKLRISKGTTEAILINAGGGIAGGDVITVNAEVGPQATLTLTSQAAERVYRSLGPPAKVDVSLKAEAGSKLFWLPQETILFQHSALQRKLHVELDENATFLGVETLLFGRLEMGENVTGLDISDHWHIKRAGKLLHVENLKLGPHFPNSITTLGDNRAMATVLLVSPEAEKKLERVRSVLTKKDGASAWNGKLVARLVARDGFHLRKTLIKVLMACAGGKPLPKTWTF